MTKHFVFLILWGRGECVSAVVEVLLRLPSTRDAARFPLGRSVAQTTTGSSTQLVAALWSSIQRSVDRQKQQQTLQSTSPSESGAGQSVQ